jgi:CheY-like chemotaxis protein
MSCLCDVDMPFMDGYEFVSAPRAKPSAEDDLKR